MGKTRVTKLWDNLDMVTTSRVKKRKLSTKNPLVFVNSGYFLMNKTCYVLQNGDVKYAIQGMLENAWEHIEKRKYAAANRILNNILLYSDKSSDTHFGKFVVMLFQEKKAFAHLKKAIETKHESSLDDYYSLYLKLYCGLIDISDDYLPLLELLVIPKAIVAFNKNSYNGSYLEFLQNVDLENYSEASKYLDKCIEMKPVDQYLLIARKLLDMIAIHLEAIEEEKKKQDAELETIRCQNFAFMVKQNDLNGARKELERILSYRNIEGKDNYIYYLFLELIEMIQITLEDVTFEVMPVTYNYTKPNEYLYTFMEAITAGDFTMAYEAGKKCKGKLLDRQQPAIKVNLYLQLLEFFFRVVQERQKEMDNIYQIVQNNILRGNYKHALELYEVNSDCLKYYQDELIRDLFTCAVASENNEPIVYIEEEIDETYDMEEEELDEVPVEIAVQELPDTELDIEEQLEMVSNTYEPMEVETPKSETINLYEVQPLLRHIEPQHEFFLNYQECLNNYHYEDARIWLAKFDRLLKENNINKRLSQYFYRINVSIQDGKTSEITDKQELYRQAYNAMMNKQYDNAISYIKDYLVLDRGINNKGYILLARINTLAGNSEQAIHNYIRANSISPDPDAYYFLGELYFKKRNWNEAIFCYLTYNEFFPKENATVYINLSECYKRVGKTSKVVKYLKIAEEINVEQKMGLYLKNRILKAEMMDKKKKEHFNLQRKSNGIVTEVTIEQ